MEKHALIDNSRRFYARLIRLYPQEHVVEYGDAMLQVFTDQCRAAVRKQGFIGLFLLWLRTFFDLGKTVLDEHLQARGAKIGLPQVSPLPWNEIWLVLIPSFVILIIYIAGIIWEFRPFDQVIEWLVYASAIPVIWIWKRTKSFPLWGLVPAGLVLRYTLSLILEIPYSLNGYFTIAWLLIMGLMMIVIVSLGWNSARHWRLSRAAYLWLGLCIFAILVQVGLTLAYNLKAYRWNFAFQVSQSARNNLMLTPLAVAEGAICLFLFIICTTRFARRFGDLSVLFLLSLIFLNNRYGTVALLGIIYSLAIIYRLLVTFVLPLWVLRAASARNRLQGITIPIVFAILTQLVLESGISTGWFFENLAPQYPAYLVAYSIFKAILLVSGFFLAMQLCQAVRPPLAGSLDQPHPLPGDDNFTVPTPSLDL